MFQPFCAPSFYSPLQPYQIFALPMFYNQPDIRVYQPSCQVQINQCEIGAKEIAVPKIENQCVTPCPTSSKQESQNNVDIEHQNSDPSNFVVKKAPAKQDNSLYVEVRSFIDYLCQKITTLSKDELTTQSKIILKEFLQKYPDSKIITYMIDRFDELNRSKDEMTKYIVRNAFLYTKNKMGFSLMVNHYKQEKFFYDTYFQDDHDFIRYLKEQYLVPEDLVPLKKCSKIRSINSKYLSILFRSEKFSNDFKEFLDKFENMMLEDNQSRIDQLVTVILSMVNKNEEEKIGFYKRVPIDEDQMTKYLKLAQSLFQTYQSNKSSGTSRKRIKL